MFIFFLRGLSFRSLITRVVYVFHNHLFYSLLWYSSDGVNNWLFFVGVHIFVCFNRRKIQTYGMVSYLFKWLCIESYVYFYRAEYFTTIILYSYRRQSYFRASSYCNNVIYFSNTNIFNFFLFRSTTHSDTRSSEHYSDCSQLYGNDRRWFRATSCLLWCDGVSRI